ncbi:ParB/RepB/Spo0J family partition protein [Mesorhizobium sp. NBSH29]|uniref:ParB/RepB/Spo0J family partition protein n=1 Tax=Mesorhizobium sp. NBSH29 TaxID=2654249 RepID=UPI0018963E92|nr:ParB/RepB/Spo0J family partition protein [Mesorhizobium sp. NBSH29]QPC86068.1 ParB/RepB/Spo0J family partition protein [Mesorhizobium sp. NBSH29]
MSEDISKKRLGRGLAALIGEMDRPAEPARQHASPDGQVPIEFVKPNPKNPRRSFAEADLTDLAQSIREHGIVQPVVVRPSAQTTGHYEIIAGERRWRAAQRAGLMTLPVIIRDVDDRVALELAIIENVQRADLNPVEEAQGYQQLMDEHHYTQADLGQVIGKSRSHVANTLRLLKLPDVIRDLLVDGSLSAGHARALVTAAEPAALAKRIVEEGLSVRQAEALAPLAASAQERPQRSSNGTDKDPDTVALEGLLSNVTGMKVTISHRDRGGDVKISYRSLEQLDELCRRLKSS